MMPYDTSAECVCNLSPVSGCLCFMITLRTCCSVKNSDVLPIIVETSQPGKTALGRHTPSTFANVWKLQQFLLV